MDLKEYEKNNRIIIPFNLEKELLEQFGKTVGNGEGHMTEQIQCLFNKSFKLMS